MPREGAARESERSAQQQLKIIKSVQICNPIRSLLVLMLLAPEPESRVSKASPIRLENSPCISHPLSFHAHTSLGDQPLGQPRSLRDHHTKLKVLEKLSGSCTEAWLAGSEDAWRSKSVAHSMINLHAIIPRSPLQEKVEHN